MNVGRFDLFYANKQYDHPKLGHIDCNALKQNYNQCLQLMGINQSQIYCIELFQLTTKCYKCSDSQQFTSWLDEKLDKRAKLLKFLQTRNSIIPGQLKKYNPYGVFDPDYKPLNQKNAALKIQDQKIIENLKLLSQLDKQK